MQVINLILFTRQSDLYEINRKCSYFTSIHVLQREAKIAE